VLEYCEGNRTHAANYLGISVRTLRIKLHEYGIGGKDEGSEFVAGRVATAEMASGAAAASA
jgi:hypothetical protein